MLYKSIGTLRYENKGGKYKLIVEVDQGISDYYRSLIPKWITVNPQMYRAHISVVRREIPVNLEYWGKYEGEKIEFSYEGIVRQGTVYFWLNVFCVRLEEIRKELGLPVRSEYTIPPEGFTKCFHCTIGNQKELVKSGNRTIRSRN